MDHPTDLQSSPSNPQIDRKIIQVGIKSYLAHVRPLDWAAGLAILLIGINFFTGLPTVPFHPDESTYIFMSSDFELFFQNPTQVFWSGTPENPTRQAYRELDAPLTRDLIGLARWISQSAGLPSDWDWSKTWEENRASGALPGPDLLLTARTSIAWLFPLALIFIYLACRTSGSSTAGFLSILILGLNPVLLLHTRRSMAEGILFFGVALVLFLLSYRRTRLLLLGAGAGIAICAKQSAAGYLPAVALAGILSIQDILNSLHRLFRVFAELSLGLLLVYGLLNPILWSNPVAALREAAAKRESLRTQQLSDFDEPVFLSTPSIARQLVLLVGEVYLVSPQFEEAGNYSANILLQKTTYLKQPLNSMLTGPIWAGIFLFLTLIGMINSSLRFSRSSPEKRVWLVILATATVGEFAFLCIALPLPFQRYAVPLFPLLGIWAGLGVESVFEILSEKHNSLQLG